MGDLVKIKSLPDVERPIEKAEKYGIETLSTVEIIAVMLNTGFGDKSAIELAMEVISKLPGGITGLSECDMGTLRQIRGIGTTKACRLLATAELAKRIAVRKAEIYGKISSADDAARYVRETLRHKKKEHFISILLDVKGQIIAMDTVSVGELSSTCVNPREVFSKAIKRSAAGIIVAHNHPSGDPEPSAEDIAITKRLSEAGRVLGIKLLDHIIIGDLEFKSLATLGYI